MSTRYWFPKRYADIVAKLRVPGGFVLVAAFAWFSHPDKRSLALGFPVSLAGLCLRAWASGHLAKNRQLARSGPYAYTRNPLYLGTLVVACGFVIASRSPALGAVFAAVFSLVYLPVIELEEQHLRGLFPEYPEYAGQVPRLSIRVPPHSSKQPFESGLYWKNREYQAFCGFAAGWLLLIWKAFGSASGVR